MFFLLLILILPFISNNKNIAINIFIFGITFLYYGAGIGNGSDWINYYKYFDCEIHGICTNDFLSFESGYGAITMAFGKIGFFYIHIFIFTINAICLYYFSSFFKKPYFIIFTFIGFYGWLLYTEQIRQALALSLILVAIISFKKNNIKSSIILTGIACLFHITAAAGFLIIASKFISKNKIIISTVIFLIFYFLFPNIIINVVGQIAGENSALYEKIKFYLSNTESESGNYLGLGSIIDISFFLLFLYNKNSARNNFNQSAIDSNISIYIFFIIILASKSQPVIYRLSYYFFPFFSIFMHDLFLTKKNHVKILIILAILLQSYRPFLHEAANFHLQNYENILINDLTIDDNFLRNLSQKKCLQLDSIGYGSLCS